MKKAKILIGISIVAALLVAMFAFSASAEAMTLKVELDKAQIEKGQEVIATVGVANYTTALAGFTVTITYDADALELKSVVPVDYDATAVVDPEDVADANGTITLVWITGEPEGFTTVNKLADLTFIAKDVENAVSGGIGAQFGTPNNPSEGMLLPGEDGAEPEVILPEDNIFSEDPADVPDIEVVPEGTLGGGGEEPGEGDNGNANNESNGNTGSSKKDVLGTYKIGDRTQMYRVEVSWGSMIFNYTEADETWNPDDHAWELDDEAAIGEWATAEDGVSNKVAFKNHSSQPVTIALGFADSVAEDTITGVWTWENEGTGTLAAVSGVGEDAVVAEGSATLALSGKLTNEEANNTAIGVATATIA